MLKQFARYLLPYWLKIGLKRAYYTFQDILVLLGKKRDPLYPPKRLNFVGSSEFKKIGDEFLGHFKTLGGLKPNDSVLDIGCGVGRMAIPLTHYVKQGSYIGFDIVKRGIDWCQKNITPKHSHFKFVHANIKNKFYNAKGTVASEDYTFPAEDKKFDFCFATSVFTHMLPDEVDHYFKETSRVMKHGSTIFFTFFLVQDEQETFVTPHVRFLYRYNKLAYYSHKDCIEAETGYPQSWVEQLLRKHGFGHIAIHPGTWKDPQGVSYQDIVVAKKI